MSVHETETAQPPEPRIAVIAVHGVADQQHGNAEPLMNPANEIHQEIELGRVQSGGGLIEQQQPGC